MPPHRSNGPGGVTHSQHYYSGQRRQSKKRGAKGRLKPEPGGGGGGGVAMSGPAHVPLFYSAGFQLRFLTPDDLPEVKRLCQLWFPIDYPDAWYNDITCNGGVGDGRHNKFYAAACVLNGRIVGIIVAETKDYFRLAREDSEILDPVFHRRRGDVQVAYILSLGVAEEYRQQGVATYMLDTLLAHLTSDDHEHVKAAYLHVLSTNFSAIRFYEKHGFKMHIFLPYYYNIRGKRKDGLTYVRYLNGGHEPYSLLDYAYHCCASVFNVSASASAICASGVCASASAVAACNPWTLAKSVVRKMANLALFQAMPRIRRIAQSSAAAVFS